VSRWSLRPVAIQSVEGRIGDENTRSTVNQVMRRADAYSVPQLHQADVGHACTAMLWCFRCWVPSEGIRVVRQPHALSELGRSKKAHAICQRSSRKMDSIVIIDEVCILMA
jgi:hypothetical protein